MFAKPDNTPCHISGSVTDFRTIARGDDSHSARNASLGRTSVLLASLHLGRDVSFGKTNANLLFTERRIPDGMRNQLERLVSTERIIPTECLRMPLFSVIALRSIPAFVNAILC